MSLRATIHLRGGDDERAPHFRPPFLDRDTWLLDLGGDAGSVLCDLQVMAPAAVMRQIAEMILGALPDAESDRCEQCGATGTHRLGCRRAGGVIDQQQRRAWWEGARRKLGLTTTDADWEAYVADDGEGGWDDDEPEAEYAGTGGEQ